MRNRESKIVELALLQGNALAFLFRWIHLLAGVAWIGLLWYFNFVQGEYFKEADASSKSDAIRKLVPRAIVIASAENVAAGGEADPAAAGALAKAGLASRTNTLFSIPMLFFMASSVHLAQLATPVMNASILSLIVVFGLILALEINGLKGKTGPMTSVKGVIHMGLLLTLVLYLGIELL
jgi:uncharacterized membrane protein